FGHRRIDCGSTSYFTNFSPNTDKGMTMKSKVTKIVVAAGLFAASAVAFAANAGCCGDIACCIKMLACCF
ncbi:hypothetical protein ABTF91_20290, partial [Acinetobacter baumannii]